MIWTYLFLFLFNHVLKTIKEILLSQNFTGFVDESICYVYSEIQLLIREGWEGGGEYTEMEA